MSRRDPASRAEWRAAIAGLAALFVGIGLGRFGYPPLIPVIVNEGLVSSNAANVGAATNFLGYLLGALGAAALAQRFGVRRCLLAALFATALSFAACAHPALGAFELSAWRLVSGVTGGVLMILAPRAVMGAVAPERRGMATGVIFAGVGSGMLVSGAALPAIGAAGATHAFLVLGALTLAASLAAVALLPANSAAPPRAEGVGKPRWRGPLLGLAIAYCGFAVGFVGHTIFLVDYIARGLSRGYGAGSIAWIVMGASGLLGVLFWGRLADRIGAQVALRIAQAAMACGVLVAASVTSQSLLLASAACVGFCAIALGSLTSVRAVELAGLADYAPTWAILTAVFSVFQAGGGYAGALLFAQTQSYPAIFTVCAAVLAATICAEMALARAASRA